MTMIDHDEREPMGQPEQTADRTDTITAQPGMSGSPLYEAAKIVPVEKHGAAPATLEHQITYAQYMAKAKLSVPEHLHGNIGDCLAVIDIATRAGLSPYMLAQKTYAQGGKLAFESQLFHALLIQSNRLRGAGLAVAYEGEGEERVCIVTGHLRGDQAPKTHRSKPLKEMHPGHSEKNGKSFVKGSPLWDDKPDVQQFYDTSRDWIRMFCPVATLGILDFYEIVEHPLPPPQGDGLLERLKGVDTTEGHKNGHTTEELARTAADNVQLKPASAEGERATIKPAKTAKTSSKPPAEEKRATTLEKKPAATKKQASAAADRAQAASDARKREADEKKAATEAKKPEQKTDDPPAKVSTKPKNDAEYNVYCRDWIDRTPDPEAAIKRWDDELQMRDDITVRIPTRNNLREYLEKKHGV